MVYHNKIGPHKQKMTKENSRKEGDEDKKLSNEVIMHWQIRESKKILGEVTAHSKMTNTLTSCLRRLPSEPIQVTTLGRLIPPQ